MPGRAPPTSYRQFASLARMIAPSRRQRQEHPLPVALRSRRAAGRRAGDPAQRPRLHRPYVQRRLFGGGRARSAPSEDGQFRRRAEEHPLAPPADPRRYSAGGQRAEHLGHAAIRQPGRLLRQVAGRFRADRAAVRRRHPRVRRVAAGEPARDRLSQHGRARRPSHLVGRRPLRLCVGAFRGLHRPRPGGGRCERSDQTGARRKMVAARNASRRRRDAARLVRQAHRAASSHQRRQHRLRRLARRRLHRSRPQRSSQAEAAQPPQLCAALRRRRAHAAAAAGPQIAGACGRGDLGQLRQRARLYLGHRRARAGKPGIDRHPADADRGRFLRQGRQVRPAQSA